MTHLTTDEISELHDLALARLDEFDSVAVHLPKLLPAYVRIVIEVYDEWQAKAYAEACRADAEDEAETPRIFEWHKQHLDYADTNGTIAVPDPTITAADLAAFESVWPNIPDLQGEDVFAAECGPPSGEPEPLPEVPFPRPIGRDRAPDVGFAAGKTHAPTNGVYVTPAPVAEYIAGNPPFAPALPTKPRPLSVADAKLQVKAERAAIIEYMQSIAEHGRMPTMTEYHGQRPKKLPMWDTIRGRHNVSSWEQMAQLCGLTYGKRHTRVASGDFDDTDAETVIEPDDDEPATEKHPRRMGYEFGRPDAEPRNQQPTMRELTDWLRANAMAGVMMSQDVFNECKPAHWSTATAHVSRLHTTWEELRIEAGLKSNPRARLQPVSVEAA